jgi:hypothetical protein
MKTASVAEFSEPKFGAEEFASNWQLGLRFV